MKRLFALLLMIGALTGLFAVQLVHASVARPPAAMAAATPVAATRDAMAGMHCPDMAMAAMPRVPIPNPFQPCKGMTLACIAAMGCVMPLISPADTPIPALDSAPEPRRLAPAVLPLEGRSFGPDPEPPSLLI